jgi:hypothetical protein
MTRTSRSRGEQSVMLSAAKHLLHEIPVRWTQNFAP